MKRVILSTIISFGLSTGTAQAGTTVSSVEQILLYENGDLAYIYPTGGVTAAPACGSSTAYYSFKLNRPRAKEYLAGLMVAQAAGHNVTLTGTGDCTDQANSETLAYYSMTK